MRGKLIVLCGTDGSGKTTQAELLSARLKKEGFAVEQADFPQYGKSFFSGIVQRYLNGEFGTADEVSPYFAAMMYAGDRFEAKEQLEKWLAEGKIIISNRYADDNKAHQGGKIQDKAERERFFKWLDGLEYKTFGIPKADLVIFLDVPFEIGQKLVDSKGERQYLAGKKRDIHEANLNHLKQAYAMYKELAKQKSWVTIACAAEGKIMPKEAIAEKVWLEISRFLHQS